MSDQQALQLGDITDDLVLLLEIIRELGQGGAATYEMVRQATAGDLHLHLLTYVRFLEATSLLTYDRISDEMEITDTGEEVRQAPAAIEDAAQEAFAEQLGDAADGVMSGDDALSDVFDDVADDVDTALAEASGEAALETSADQVVAGGGDAFSGASTDVAPDAALRAQQQSMTGSNHNAPNQGPTTSVPMEENPMNGEMDAAEAQWSESEGEGAAAGAAFERIEELGSGGIGTVYRGRQVRLDREVAIKEIREIFNVFAGIQRGDIIARFQNIVEAQASLVHPNVIQLIDVDTTGEYPFSVMQLAPNGNLRRLLDEGDRPPLKVSMKYFLQMLHALNAAHDQDIVHGSLKPENVVLDHAGNAMMTDFGISKIVEREGGAGNQVYVGVGSVAYMSPEQFQDPNLSTISTDIYSLGIMFYEMLTGKVPGRRSPMPSSFYPDIPRALDDIFDQMTMDREEDRYDSIDAIIADLYGSEDVMALLDKRSGVLFLRDPIAHGELGLGDDVDVELAEEGEAAAGQAPAADGDDDAAEDGGDEAEQADDDTAEDGDDGDGADDADDAAEDGDEESDAEPDEVLDKLDEYGEMFEEEGEDD